MKLIVASRDEVEQGLGLSVPHILVSIRDPEMPRVRLTKNRLRRGVLRLAFHDAEPSPGFVLPSDIQLMTDAQAGAIWRFVQKHVDSVEAIVVQCEQGMSRSPAVAAGLAVGMGDTNSAVRFARDYQPNQYVFSLVVKAAKRGC